MGQPEGRLARAVIKMVVERGGYAWKQHGNEYMPAGMPDVVGSYRGFFVAAETKMPGNDLSAVQVYRIRQIRAAGGRVVAPCRSIHEVTEMLDAIDEQMRTWTS